MLKKPFALVLDTRDNVATLLTDAAASELITLKGADGTMQVSEDIASGHKVALKPIQNGCDIVKYGQKIGIATNSINPGEWVHLHNMTSRVDTTFKNRIES